MRLMPGVYPAVALQAALAAAAIFIFGYLLVDALAGQQDLDRLDRAALSIHGSTLVEGSPDVATWRSLARTHTWTSWSSPTTPSGTRRSRTCPASGRTRA